MSQKRTFPGQDTATTVMRQRVQALLFDMEQCLNHDQRLGVVRQALAFAYRMGAEDAQRAMASAVDAVTEHSNRMYRGEA